MCVCVYVCVCMRVCVCVARLDGFVSQIRFVLVMGSRGFTGRLYLGLRSTQLAQDWKKSKHLDRITCLLRTTFA